MQRLQKKLGKNFRRIEAGRWILVRVNNEFREKIIFMSYKNLEIWQMAKELTNEVHQMSLSLPKFELYEEGQQIRRSMKSVRSCIVEGYGRRFYKQDYIKFIIYALASNDETIDHLEILFETKSISDEHNMKLFMINSKLWVKKSINICKH